MKTLLNTLACCLILALTINPSYSQTYTTESKSCGSCGKEVSIYSRVGMTCPHCGVTWGRENETRQQTTNSYNYRNEIDLPKVAFTKSTANVRTGPSKNYPVKTTLRGITLITILSIDGAWYYVEYTESSNIYYNNKQYGYIHKSLIDIY